MSSNACSASRTNSRRSRLLPSQSGTKPSSPSYCIASVVLATDPLDEVEKPFVAACPLPTAALEEGRCPPTPTAGARVWPFPSVEVDALARGGGPGIGTSDPTMAGESEAEGARAGNSEGTDSEGPAGSRVRGFLRCWSAGSGEAERDLRLRWSGCCWLGARCCCVAGADELEAGGGGGCGEDTVAGGLGVGGDTGGFTGE